MDLVLEIEHLLGVAFAVRSPAETLPDWPPQADRVFSALVAAWGARGERPDERLALEWLEAQTVPEIAASGGYARTTATVFVPPNDPQSGRVAERMVMPDFRKRQPRRFPAFRPDDPHVHLVWRNIEIDEKTLAGLNTLAAHTAYVGHSASLTRCRFSIDSDTAIAPRARRRIYKGRLAELERAYNASPPRRPRPGEIVRATADAIVGPTRSVFASHWLVLEHIRDEKRRDEQMPDLRASALVSKALRAALMSGYKSNGGERAVPSIVSGHAPDGSPFVDPHLAIVPLAFVGREHAHGHVLGFALVPPGEGELLDDSDFQDAVRKITTWNAEGSRAELALSANGFKLTFSLSVESALRSLDPNPYVAAARTWATCTPVVLDRHLKAKRNAQREAEIEELLRQASMNVGLPQPARVASGKHSAIAGAPSAYPSGHAPRWMGWRLPPSFASRQLTHAVLQFDEPVRGPVILGAGRFNGLGLCRALDARKES